MESFLEFFKKVFSDEKQEEIKSIDKESNIEKEEDTELIATITAAIAFYLQSDTSTFYVKSIVRLPETAPVWARVGRQEQMRTRL